MQSEPPAKRILVVDDDESTREGSTVLLRAWGYAVDSARDGGEALEWLRRSPPPSLILLDLAMPGVDGREFRRLQQEDPALARIPVVVVSATGQAAQRADQLGDVGYLQKPYGAADLLAVVERFARPQKPSVLVVESEPAVLTMLDKALRHFGFAVRLAAQGSAALEAYRNNRGAIDVVLLDVRMPDMGGPELLAALRAIDRDVRAVFMAGHSGGQTSADLAGTNVAAIVTKPFPSLAELARCLWDVAERQSARARS
jgi:CheY-like chemotaxis protein